MKEFIEKINSVQGVKGVSIMDKDGIKVYGTGEGDDVFVALIPLINRMRRTMVELGTDVDELVLKKNDGLKVLIKEKENLFYCVLYDPEEGGFDGRIRHYVESFIESVGR